MKYRVFGTLEDIAHFKRILPESLIVSSDDFDFQIYVIDDVKTLLKIPKSFQKKTFFYVKVKDQKIFEKLSLYKVNGIIYPPLDRDKIIKKLNINLNRLSESVEIIKSKVIAKAESLPALPSIIHRLLQLTTNDKSTFKEVIVEVKKDQGLVGKVLRIVNSPFYGIRKEITSIDRAAILLGMNTIKNIALAAFSMDLFNKNLANYNTDSKSLWLHSFVVARIAEEIGKLHNNLDADSLYLAGLMHDLGKIVLVDFLTKPISSAREEDEMFGINHAETSALILKKWNVDDSIVNAVRNHHTIVNDDHYSLAIYYANLLSKADVDFENIINELCEKLGISLFDLSPRVEMVLKENYDEFF
ncbi:HDOD domain-containing protein [Deferribacter autotrophicus]|uniref:HDOD domain-containing protein n=1 Tax=Deferribacter autotrophicus TaxID=500465 RepID=A0A5A8F3C9_9BACT|nr:HDOD domain-containing protein [Deferribacter autotrophicus]KAA0258358.1 HDOD domain-containing protein [Deferribacter autotrophicus]